MSGVSECSEDGGSPGIDQPSYIEGSAEKAQTIRSSRQVGQYRSVMRNILVDIYLQAEPAWVR